MKPTMTLLISATLLTLGACADQPSTTPQSQPDKAAKTPPPPKAGPNATGPDAGVLATKAKAMFKPLPTYMGEGGPADSALVTLGRSLYYEPRLSKNQDISCNSCHLLDKYGVDGEPTSPGHKGQRGTRNSPTTYNAALHATQFWDGRSPDVEDQSKGPVLNPVEMAIPDEATVITVLSSIPGYVDMFKAAFPEATDPISFDNYAKAVGAFERGLVTPSPFDAFLEGDLTALNNQQLVGLQTYMDTGCGTCHSGASIGGTGFFKLGQVKDYQTADAGRFDVTHDETDRTLFKPPGLRNVTKTGPYYHDGSIGSLDEAVKLMGTHQLGKELTAQQTAQIIAFLDSLTGELPTEWIAKPDLPESGPNTPAPDPS